MLQDKQLSFLVDPVLRNDDINNDGLIDYAEFIASQIKNRVEARAGVRSGLSWVEVMEMMAMVVVTFVVVM